MYLNVTLQWVYSTTSIVLFPSLPLLIRHTMSMGIFLMSTV